MNKLLIVYNTCGINGGDRTDWYMRCLESLFAQDFTDCKLCVSDCLTTESNRKRLVERLNGRAALNFIDEKVPISVTFNDSVEKCVKAYGDFEGYLYVDSGILPVEKDSVRRMFELFKSGPYAMVAGKVDNDMDFDWYYGKNNQYVDGQLIPVGKSLNLHVQIFSQALRLAYNRVLPDIFASYCMESVFSFMCAGIEKKWAVSDTMFLHNKGVDGASSGFSDKIEEVKRKQGDGRGCWNHAFGTTREIKDIIAKADAVEGYVGYEQVANVLMHDPSKFDENGYAKSIKTLEFLRDNFYLTESEFPYSAMKSEFIAQ